MTTVSVHDLTVEQYDALDVLELHGQTAVWKQINTPTIELVFFKPLPPADAHLAGTLRSE